MTHEREFKAPLSHLVLINPVRRKTAGEIYIPEMGREAHVQLGWVEGTSDVLEEDLSVGDLVVWLSYRQQQAPEHQYEHWKKDWYWLHEDDCLFVIEDW